MNKKDKSLIIAAGGLLAAGGFYYFYKNRRMIPEGLKAVENFDLKRYLGTWNEIARLDYKYERNLEYVTATYTMNDDGTVKVTNKGYNAKTDEWQESVGEAKFRGDYKVAALKASFFKPFYAGYNVIALTEDYRHALVCGDSKSNLWLLSRDRFIPDFILKSFLQHAAENGFETDQLIWPKT